MGVVSNIGWDLRPVFRAHGLDRYVDTYVLSYEHGIRKPDTRLFSAACAALGADPAETPMVGDDRHAGGGAASLGCSVHFVDHLPVARASRGPAARARPGALTGAGSEQHRGRTAPGRNSTHRNRPNS